MTNQLAIIGNGATAPDRLTFTDERLQQIRNQICKGGTDAEMEMFCTIAQRRGLDPFAKQIYFIKYGQQAAAFVVSIDALRLIADRTNRYAPGAAAAYQHDKQGELESSTAYVKKLVAGQWHEVSETAYYKEFNGGTPNWKKMPRVMLSKCAEARALRRAFPEDLGGLYTTDEIESEEKTAYSAPVKAARTVTAVVTEVAPVEAFAEEEEMVDADDVVAWYDAFQLALNGTPAGNEDGLNRWVAASTKQAAATLSDFLGTNSVPKVQALYEHAQNYGNKKRDEIAAKKPAPDPLTAAVRAKVESAKVGDPDGELVFEQETPAGSPPLTDAQDRAIASQAARYWGREQRDEQLQLHIASLFPGKTVSTLNISQASHVIGGIQAMNENAAANNATVAPAEDKPKGGAARNRLMAIIAAKGLSMDDTCRDARLAAINAWLLKHDGKTQIASTAELTQGLCQAVGGAIDDGHVTWGDAVEGEIV